MRVLMISGDRLTAAGGKGPLYETQRGLSRYFERVDILLPRPDRAVTTRAILGNVHLHPADCGRAGLVGFWKQRGEELIRETKPGLIVSHDYGMFQTGRAAAALSRASGVPYLSEIHGVPGYPIASDLRERFKLAATKLYLRWARERALAFRVVNQADLAPFLGSQGVPAEKILVLRALYIDLGTFRRVEASAAREQDVVWAGRFDANKGLELIIDAIALAKSRGRRRNALLIGKGPLEHRIRERARSRGVADQVAIRGWTDSKSELAESYRRSGLVVCASGCEGGPRSTVEAMACGIPAVSTPVGMMKELVRDGENGWLCGFDAASLAAAFEQVLGDESRRVAMGHQAWTDVQPFEYERTIRDYAAGLHRLAGETMPQSPRAAFEAAGAS
ncbi:MAG: glycosyltransferase family 4 protein [Planctomycetota bacterium]